MTEEQLTKFRSDFRVVAEYFVKSRVDPDYQPEPKEIKHIDAVLKLLSVITGDDRFEESLSLPEEGRPRTMSEVLDRRESKGRAEGRFQALAGLVRDGLISLKDAAVRSQMTEDNFLSLMSTGA